MNELTVNPYEMFEVDANLENEVGIVASYPVKGHPNRGFRIRFVYAGDTNVHYREALRARLKPLSYRIQQELVSDEEYEDIVIATYADKVIKSWESIDENGQWVSGIYGNDFVILPFEKKTVIDVFSKGRRLFKDIKKQADAFSTFHNNIVEEAVKN